MCMKKCIMNGISSWLWILNLSTDGYRTLLMSHSSYSWRTMRNTCGRTSLWNRPTTWHSKTPKTSLPVDLILKKLLFLVIWTLYRKYIYTHKNLKYFLWYAFFLYCTNIDWSNFDYIESQSRGQYFHSKETNINNNYYFIYYRVNQLPLTKSLFRNLLGINWFETTYFHDQAISTHAISVRQYIFPWGLI